ncbi:hypothetical protein L596_025105 [Steinernema carpocapsae]|uniref:Nuclear receptor domain-containing protein n=1 Tax=Steinernema carpocapsae TaxID=34508 RepID=A0A4U5M6W2_STECR|nr:hypothetical protein L596_025105 [Steinernema carpocapsae]
MAGTLHSPTSNSPSSTSPSGDLGICTACGVTNNHCYHYSALSCKNCAQMFKRNAAKPETLVCRKNAEFCEPGFPSHCTKCRFDRCLKIGMKPELIQNYNKERHNWIVETHGSVASFVEKGFKVRYDANTQLSSRPSLIQPTLLTILMRVVTIAKRMWSAENTSNSIRAFPAGETLRVILEPQNVFFFEKGLIEMFFDKIPFFAAMGANEKFKFVDAAFPYYLTHWTHVCAREDLDTIKAEDKHLFVNRSTYVDLSRAVGNSSPIPEGIEECSKFARSNTKTLGVMDLAFMLALTLGKISVRFCSQEQKTEVLARVAEITRQWEDQWRGNEFSSTFRSIMDFVGKVDMTASCFLLIRSYLLRQQQPVQNHNLWAMPLSPQESSIPFYFDGCTDPEIVQRPIELVEVVEIPSEFSAFRRWTRDMRGLN